MKKNVKINLKKIREEKGMTQLQVCELCGISVKVKKLSGEYGYLESGKRLPRIDKALKIARALNVRCEEIWQI